jgi:hypothetical protein
MYATWSQAPALEKFTKQLRTTLQATMLPFIGVSGMSHCLSSNYIMHDVLTAFLK